MVYTAAVLLFLLAAVSLYALIVSRRNYMLLFLLVPIMLVSSIYSSYTLYSLQGKPINGIPQGEVELVWIEISNPDILFLARSTETGGTPTYYRIAYTDQNVQEMAGLLEDIQQGGQATGNFQGESDGEGDIEFTPPPRTPRRPKPIESDRLG